MLNRRHEGPNATEKLDIKDLRDGMRRVDAEGEIVDISEPRNVNLRTGGEARVADCTLRDSTGSIKISIWDDQIDAVQQDAKFRVTNVYHTSFRDRLQLH